MGSHKIVNEEEVLEHARAVFLEKGALGSTKEIARRAGVSEAVLFQRFPTKAALFLAAMVPPQIDAEAVVAAGASMSDPRKGLCAISEAMLEYFRSMMPVVLHLLTHPAVTMADVMSHFEKSASMRLLPRLAAHLRGLNETGKAMVKNPDSAAALLVSAIHSVALFELLGAHGGQFPKAGVKALVDALWNGLAPRE